MPETDWGYILARLAMVYGFKPWDVAAMTEAQIEMYMIWAGPMMLDRDHAMLAYHFGKIDAEARQKIVSEAEKAADPNGIDARAWKVFTRRYQTMPEEEASESDTLPALALSPEAAEGIVSWWESGDLYRLPEGSLLWRTALLPIRHALTARAAELKK